MSKNRLFDEHGNEVTGKIKKPFYKKVWFWIFIIVLFFAFGNLGNTDEEAAEEKKVEEVPKESYVKKETKQKKKKIVEKKEEPKYKSEMIDNITVFTNDSDIVLGINQHLSNFSYDMTQELKKRHNEIENGAIFRNVSTLTDKYGNEEPTVTVVVYYSPKTIEAINYENWPILDASGLYDTADATWVHYALKDSKVKNNAPSDTSAIPDIYYSMQGASYDK